MNILITSPHGLYEDYSFSFVHNQARAYAALGHRVRVVLPLALGKKNDDGKRFGKIVHTKVVDGVEICHVRHLSLGSFGAKRFNKKTAVLAFRCLMRAITADFQPDVIHGHTLDLGSEAGTFFKKRFGCPLVVTTHGGDTFVAFDNGRQAYLRRNAQKADAVVCVSSLLRRRLEECGVSTPMPVILNGFNLSYASDNAQKDPNLVIQVGNLIPRKKTDVSIRAVAKLKERIKEIHFTSVGAGPERERMEKLCKELDVENCVSFTGQLHNQEVLQKMSEATFFVMPSVNEGFGIVYLEAMAAGCVVIGTEGEGIADLIVNGENGFLVPADDPDAVADLIQTCAEDPQRTALIAARGKEAAQKLTWEYNARQYQTLFQNLMKGETL